MKKTTHALLVIFSLLAASPYFLRAGITPAVSKTLMLDGNGAVIAPTNFFAANASQIVAVGGGGSLSSKNIVPAGALFDAGGSYTFPNLATNGTFYFDFSGVTNDPDLVMYDSDDTHSWVFSQGTNVVFDLSTWNFPVTLLTSAAANYNQAVKVKVYPVSTNVFTGKVAGTLSGNFTGTIQPGSLVDDSALSGNVARRNQPLAVVSLDPYAQGFNLYGSSTLGFGDGSTFNLHKIGTNGFADINFLSDNHNTNFGLTDPRRYTLLGALGVGVLDTNQFPYNEPYWECYGQHSFNFVQYGPGVFGSVNGTNGNFTWYQSKTSDTNNAGKMFEINRAAGVVSNLCSVYVQSNLTAAAAILFQPGFKPSAAQLGVNGVGWWNSNGVLYAVGSANGSTYSFTNKIAP